MKKALLIISFSFLTFTDTVVAATLPIGQKFRGLIEKFLPEGYDLQWQDGEVDFSLSGVKFKSKKFCFSKKDSRNQVCFEKAKIDLKISQFQVALNESSAELQGGSIFWVVEESGAATNSESVRLHDSLNEALQGLLKIKKLKLLIGVNDVHISLGENEILAKNIEVEKKSEKTKLKIRSLAFPSQKLTVKEFLTDIDIDEKKFAVHSLTKVDVVDNPTLLVEISLKDYEVGSARPISFSTQVRGKIVKDGGGVNLPCDIQILKNGGENVSCGLATNLAAALNLQKIRSLPLTSKMSCQQRTCSFDVKIDQILSGEVSVSAKSIAEWQKGHLEIEVLNFSDLAEVLRKMNVGVPVPLAESRGTIHLKSSFSHRSFQDWKVPLTLKSNLSSENQVVKLNISSKINWASKTANIDSKIEIDEFVVILPELGLGPLPALSGDDRIVREFTEGRQLHGQPSGQLHGQSHRQEQSPNTEGSILASSKRNSSDGLAVNFNVEVKTSKKGAIQILSERLKNPLRLSCDLQSQSGQPLTGWIAIEETELEVLKRQASVKTLKISIAKEFSESELQGLIKIQQGVYDISVILRGSLGDPIVRLESDPTLSEGEIVSVLLYGHKSSELDGGDSDVADAKSKIASRSLGLLSLYVFSATPIDSILYNAEEKTVTANLSLAGNRISLTEQNSSLKSVGVERRIYKNIFLRSQREFGDDTSTTTTLEWENRY